MFGNDVGKQIPIFMGIENEKGELSFTFLPQIYHKLNLLMLWWFKCMEAYTTEKIF